LFFCKKNFTLLIKLEHLSNKRRLKNFKFRKANFSEILYLKNLHIFIKNLSDYFLIHFQHIFSSSHKKGGTPLALSQAQVF
ncbi:MAG: hypothetical protein D6797_00185, partial [Bdellovibrio sp.]